MKQIEINKNKITEKAIKGRRPDIFVTTELAHNTKGAAHRNMKKNGKLIFRCSAPIIGD